MADDDRTRARRPDGTIFRGSPTGYTERRSDPYTDGDRHTARRPDGLVFKGEEKGYVDPKGRVRRPDGFVFRGEQVANLEGGVARDLDGAIFRGQKWGYVDDKGNVRQRDGLVFRGRIIGHVQGPHADKALAHFVFAFDRLAARLQGIEARERERPDDPFLPGRADELLELAMGYDALGDFEGLEKSLRAIKSRVEDRLQKNLRYHKESLLEEADRLSYSSDWKAASARLKEIRAGWNERPVALSKADAAWDALVRSIDRFYKRRQEHFEKADAERAANLRVKENLTAQAESLAGSTDWKATGETMKSLMARWKEVGPVPREHTEPLWQRFSAARQRFYDRRAVYFDARDRETAQNAVAKEALCRTAEGLASALDLRAAADSVKGLQAQWKTIGHVPREKADALWDRFRTACDLVFAAKKAARRSSMQEALDRKSEHLSRLLESIDHDRGLVSGWESTIDNLRPGGRADEIRDSLRSKIESVEDRIRSKSARAEEIADAIRDIRAKL